MHRKYDKMYLRMDIKIISFQEHGNKNASLSVAECMKEIPFNIKRIYYLYNVNNCQSRGHHAHKNLQQVYIAISGSMKIMLDDGKHKKIITLKEPNKGLYIGKNIWRNIYDFSKNGVLLVLASELYNEKDYIRDYKQYKDYIKNRKI